jgi:hypothetical protein
MRCTVALALAFVMFVESVSACTLCDPGNLKLRTWREEAKSCNFVVIGKLSNPRLVGDNGVTDLLIDDVVKSDPALGKNKQITLPRWQPVDPKKPPTYLIFVDVYQGKFDPYRGVMLKSKDAGDYLKGALQIDDKDRLKALLHAFKHLDSSDTDIAHDAFLELAKAADAEIGAIATELEPSKLRTLLTDPKTQADRLGLYAYLLGACGKEKDAELLASMVAKSDERTSVALSGLLGGLIEMRPTEGWALALKIIDDPKRGYNDKLAVLSTIRFFHGFKPDVHRKAILQGMTAIIARGDMADMAIEDLRRWKWTDLSTNIVACYGKPTHSAPLVKNAIIRYALCSPDTTSTTFITSLRRTDAKLVQEIEESIEYERTPAPKSKP